MKIQLKIGARDSRLSLLQSQDAIQKIQKIFPEIFCELQGFSSPGDKNQTLDLRQSPSDFFTQDLDMALKRNEIDAAIHSAKDLAYPLPNDFDWFWLPWKEDSRDAIILPLGQTFKDLPPNPRIGISSERREQYCKKNFPQCSFKPIRGTIERRLEQLDSGDFDLIIMAVAALNRLQLTHRINQYIEETDLPSPDGQGALAITFRQNDERFQLLRQFFIPAVTFAGGGIGTQAASLAVINALKNAEICLYDDLLDPSLLDFCQGEKISVGKRSGAHRFSQTEITALICDYARQGKRLVRLKGGDPGIFGRLTEETDALNHLQITYRVLPGIPTLCSATTGTGLLLTRRAESRGFCVMTPNQQKDNIPEIMPQVITKQPLVLFMSIGKIHQISQELLEQFSPITPVAAIFNAGMNDELILQSDLIHIEEQISTHFGTYVAEKSPPGLLLIGNFSKTSWPTFGPLAKVKIWGTCSETLKEEFLNTIIDFGGKGIAEPLIKLVPELKDQSLIDKLQNNDYVLISSPSSARAFLKFIQKYRIASQTLPQIISCGPGTTAELEQFNLFPCITPKQNFSSDGLCDVIKSQLPVSVKILRLRNETAGPKLADELIAAGYQVAEHIIYRNETISLENPPCCDIIFFASSSAVKTALQQFGIDFLSQKQLLAIGQPTASTISKIGLTPLISPEATVKAAISYLAARKTVEKLKPFALK